MSWTGHKYLKLAKIYIPVYKNRPISEKPICLTAYSIMNIILGKINDAFSPAFFSEYVSEHWKEDDFFGFQFLNATNPNVIRRCSKLPPNFSVTEEMVAPFLEAGSTLKTEMEVGHGFVFNVMLFVRLYDFS